MDSSPAIGRAAFALGLCVFLSSWPETQEPPSAPCVDPVEVSALAGHTTGVDCRSGALGPPVRGPARMLFGLRLDPNRADAETLATIPGIGPVRAAAIVSGRVERPYRELSDVARVRGIGPVTLAKLEPFFVFPDSRQDSSKLGSLPKSGVAPPGGPS